MKKNKTAQGIVGILFIIAMFFVGKCSGDGEIVETVVVDTLIQMDTVFQIDTQFVEVKSKPRVIMQDRIDTIVIHGDTIIQVVENQPNIYTDTIRTEEVDIFYRILAHDLVYEDFMIGYRIKVPKTITEIKERIEYIDRPAKRKGAWYATARVGTGRINDRFYHGAAGITRITKGKLSYGFDYDFLQRSKNVTFLWRLSK